ncbi:MAG: TM2 domain-containing protein [Pseudomonadota bacterium]
MSAQDAAQEFDRATVPCDECGARLSSFAYSCDQCGAVLPSVDPALREARRRRLAAAVIAFFFLGGMGIHRFYLGQYNFGAVYLAFAWTPIPWLVAIVDGFVFAFSRDEAFLKRPPRPQ